MMRTELPAPAPSADAGPASLIPLIDFAPPSLPTDEWLRQTIARARVLFARDTDRPFIAADKLERATLRMLDEVVAPPACGPAMDELAATIGAREAEGLEITRLTLVILPPCDENDVVGSWAARDGHTILPPPARASLTVPMEAPLDLSGERLLVIPSLDRWFLRHHDGLTQVRRLLDALDTTDRRCVVGCSSWAWAFLSMAVAADLILPQGLTFQPFAAERLQEWFGGLSEAGPGARVQFRMVDSGDTLLDGAAPARDEFFDKLAALSRGSPWVAWHLWRQALRSNDDQSVPTADDHEHQRTLWVAALNELVLPGHHPQVALLVLHSLLIHGTLSADELLMTIPTSNVAAIVASLANAGFVQRRDGVYRVRTAAYPSVRSGLLSAGFPQDAL